MTSSPRLSRPVRAALAAALALIAAPARADLPPADFGYDPDRGAFIRTRDQAWELNPYAMVQLQHVSLFEKGEVSSTTFSLHSAKLILHGHVFDPTLTYHFQLNAGEGKVVAENIYLRWDPDLALGILAGQIEKDATRELTAGASYYFRGHRLKLQADASRLETRDATVDYRVRTQLEIFM